MAVDQARLREKVIARLIDKKYAALTVADLPTIFAAGTQQERILFLGAIKNNNHQELGRLIARWARAYVEQNANQQASSILTNGAASLEELEDLI